MPQLSEVAAAAVSELADRHRIQIDDAKVVHQHSNIAVALPSAGLMVRVGGNPDALASVQTSVHVTRWLTGRGYPCVPPADIEPFLLDGRVVSVWRLLDTADAPPGTARELGELLRVLHSQPSPPFNLSTFDDPLASLSRAVEQPPDGVAEADRRWLLDRIEEMRDSWAQLDPARPEGLIHGDGHTNNLIRLSSGEAILGDWDHTAHGRREWDLIQPHYMRRRFARHSNAEIDEFASAYGWDVREWNGAETMIRIREISGLSPYVRNAGHDDWSRRELSYRLHTLRSGDAEARWNSPTDR